MISLLITSAIGLTALQAGIDGPRKNFVACLRGAYDTALTQKVAVPEYGAFILKTCGAQADSLKSGLVGFDVKNGIKRSQASADAQAQVDDYVAMASEKYESKVGKLIPAIAPAPSPPPNPIPPVTQASAPKN